MTVLANKIAMVTGASSGIGRATALLFASEGASLVVTARRQSELDKLVAEIKKAGGKAVAVAGDVKDESLAKQLVDTAIKNFGGLDIAFNNAGSSGEMAPVPDLSTAGWRDTLDTNLTSCFFGAKYQVPAMLKRGGGSIVFTSSFVGHTVGFPGTVAYAAAKAGIVGLTQVLAAEFGAKGIRANAILPGGTQADSLPYAGVWRGPDGFKAWMKAMAGNFTSFGGRDAKVMVEGNDFVVVLTFVAEARKTGKHIEMPIAQVNKIRNGRFLEVRPFYWDTAAMNAALGHDPNSCH